MNKKTISWDLAKALKAGSHFKWVAWPEVQKLDSRLLFYPFKHRLPDTQIVATDIPAVKSKEEKGGVEVVVQLWGPKVKEFRAARAGKRGWSILSQVPSVNFCSQQEQLTAHLLSREWSPRRIELLTREVPSAFPSRSLTLHIGGRNSVKYLTHPSITLSY